MRLHIQFQTVVELPSSCVCSIHMAILTVVLLEDACGGALSRTICVTYVVATVFGDVLTMQSMQGLVKEQVPEPLEESKRCYWRVFLLFFYLTHCVHMIYPMTVHFTFFNLSFLMFTHRVLFSEASPLSLLILPSFFVIPFLCFVIVFLHTILTSYHIVNSLHCVDIASFVTLGLLYI